MALIAALRRLPEAKASLVYIKSSRPPIQPCKSDPEEELGSQAGEMVPWLIELSAFLEDPGWSLASICNTSSRESQCLLTSEFTTHTWYIDRQVGKTCTHLKIKKPFKLRMRKLTNTGKQERN